MEGSKYFSQLADNCKKLSGTHMREVVKDQDRNKQCVLTFDKLVFDFTHEKVNQETIDLLAKFAEEQKVKEKFQAMFNGEKINCTEKRSVLHTALRRKKEDKLVVDGEDVVANVHEVLNRVKGYTDKVRNGELTGFTGKKLKNFISIGIGGSYLGCEFIYQALKYNDKYAARAEGKNL